MDLFDIAVARKLSSGGGGGGSSDFSMANVTVTNSTPAMEWIGVINPIDEADSHALGVDFEIIQGTNEFQCVLYKGLGWIDMLTFSQHGLTITVSGNATYNGEGQIDVTGDCTITIS